MTLNISKYFHHVTKCLTVTKERVSLGSKFKRLNLEFLGNKSIETVHSESTLCPPLQRNSLYILLWFIWLEARSTKTCFRISRFDDLISQTMCRTPSKNSLAWKLFWPVLECIRLYLPVWKSFRCTWWQSSQCPGDSQAVQIWSLWNGQCNRDIEIGIWSLEWRTFR